MKLTKQKLEQLIMEEYKSMSRRVFDKRRQYPADGITVPIDHEDRTVDSPGFENKLTTLGTSGPGGYHQAKDLADTLDEPLQIPIISGNEQTFEINSLMQDHFNSPEFQLHYHFLMDDRGSSFLEEPDIGEIYDFARERGHNPYDTREKIMKSYEFFVQHEYVIHGGFDPDEEVKKVFPTAGLGIRKRYERKR